MKYSFLALGFAGLLTSCSEDSWNDHLEGFEVPNQYTDANTVNVTLTGSDYAKIAGESRNKEIAEANGQSEALAAIGTNGYFSTADEARLYLPAFLRDSTLTYFTMDNGASVNVTYDLITELPEIVKSINSGVIEYTLEPEDYQKVWGSDDDFINGFAPMKPASASLPGILADKFGQALQGEYAVVTYNKSDVNPVFGNAGGGEPTLTWEPTSLLTEDVDVDDELTIHGWVAAIDNRGFVLADKAGAILFYQSNGWDPSAVSLGDKVIVNGTVSSYGAAYQFDASKGATYQVMGSDKYTYPTAKAYTGAEMDVAVARTNNSLAKYVSFTGKVSINDNKYFNFIVDGAETAQGSGYQLTDEQKAWFTDGQQYTVTGYFVSISNNKYFNVVPVSVTSASGKPAMLARRAPATEVSTNVENALYYFDGSKWSEASNALVLNPADYTAMGQKYGNFSGSGDTQYIPSFLKLTYPYALEDDVMTVVYKYYNGSSTSFRATQFVLTGSEWVKNGGAATDKFTKKEGYWNYNPSVEITLPYSRNTDPSYSYYMACCEWVLENVVKPIQPDATLTTSEYYIDYRGNAEFYSGASAYYGNVDIRATTAKNNAPADAYDGMSDSDIVNLLKKRFTTETLPYALAKMNPTAVPVEGMDITYTVNFTAYTGAAEANTIVYRVVGPTQFEYVSSTWGEGIDSDWKVVR